ncbi:hypothetical protein DL764_009867 [Monosporascus ibericus]|uniref:lytic cellulose monooxygenase (C4-dehydrogenating) n=1 Tax=Monosporascus ibericus TaxID=155417 RepID=A0A4Q4SW85_9PEZI|nr:hypothetical protein DL764_009867 [Monosporascus ibericus]
MIALHIASSPQGAQLYMECAQINISGGKATTTPQTHSIPGIYMAISPYLSRDPLEPTRSCEYTIPGPNVFIS